MQYTSYTDGSYMHDTPIGPVYGSAFILLNEQDDIIEKGSSAGNDAFVSYRNTTGEILAVMLLCSTILRRGDITELTLIHDHEGVANWARGTWKRNNELTKKYYHYMSTYVLPNVKITFQWTKGHIGVRGNEIVDKLAKQAIYDFIAQNESQRG